MRSLPAAPTRSCPERGRNGATSPFLCPLSSSWPLPRNCVAESVTQPWSIRHRCRSLTGLSSSFPTINPHPLPSPLHTFNPHPIKSTPQKSPSNRSQGPLVLLLLKVRHESPIAPPFPSCSVIVVRRSSTLDRLLSIPLVPWSLYRSLSIPHVPCY